MKCLTFILLGWLSGGRLWGQGAGASLEELERGYAEDRAAALRRVLARYVDELKALEASLAASQDAAGATRVRLERERVFPALGLPAVEARGADDFAAFEEAVEVPLALVPRVLPRDFKGLVGSLLPLGAGVPAGAAPEGAADGGIGGAEGGAGGKGARRLLRMASAQRSGVYDAASGYEFWTEGKTAAWVLEDLPAGTYRLVLRYACSEQEGGGGKLLAQMGSAAVEEVVPGTGGWNRRREWVVGPFAVSGGRVDVVLKAASLASGGKYLMDFTALQVQPVSGAATPP